MTEPSRRAIAERQARNYRLVQLDSVPVGVLTIAGTFVPVFLVRLGASGTEVGLLTSLPAFTAFLLAIPVGRWMQGRRNIVPLYSRLRLTAWSGYAVMALAVVLFPRAMAATAVIVVWALASLPSMAGLVAFPIVMDGAAGPHGRFDLLGRRWATAGVATTVAVAVAGQALGLVSFPENFEALFVVCSIAGVISFALSSRFDIPDQVPLARAADEPARVRLRALRDLIVGNRTFLDYESRALVVTIAAGLTAPLLPLLYVNEIHAPDSWIGIIGAAQSVGAVAGYIVARRISRGRSGFAILLPSMLVAALVPAVMAALNQLPLVALTALVGGIATAGTQLALFNELMRRIPRSHGVTFSSVDQSLQNLGLIVSPSVGGLLAVTIGVRQGLVVAGVVALIGFAMFGLEWRAGRRSRAEAQAT